MTRYTVVYSAELERRGDCPHLSVADIPSTLQASVAEPGSSLKNARGSRGRQTVRPDELRYTAQGGHGTSLVFGRRGRRS